MIYFTITKHCADCVKRISIIFSFLSNPNNSRFLVKKILCVEAYEFIAWFAGELWEIIDKLLFNS